MGSAAAGDDAGFLFSEAPVAGPLDELRLVFEKRLARCASIGDRDAEAALRAAYELARETLEASVGKNGEAESARGVDAC